MAEAKVLHRGIRRLAGWAVLSFFSEIHIIGEENIPKEGPLIVAATHHNMMLDPAVLSTQFPHRRMLNYWTKASLFANKIAAWVLLSSGNIPVDRKSKDNQVLFKGTFDALSRGEAVALFPEGTSYTEPAIMQVKDGASWAGLEYMKWVKQDPSRASKKALQIVPVGIVYTNKSKYRSRIVMEFGQPIIMSDFEEQFLSDTPGEPRAAVKKLTRRIESDLVRFTVNAPDWDTLFSARMARDLLWEKDNSINLDDFVAINQTLVDLFSTPDITPNIVSVRRRLLEYYSLLDSSKLTNAALTDLPLPRNLSPNVAVPIPSRIRILSLLIRDTIAVIIRLPFFAFPLMIHLPAYAAAKWAGHLVEHEEETQAQNKIVFGLVLLLVTYPMAFYFLWALFLYTHTGAIVAAGTVWLFAVYHVKIIDDSYERAKKLVAAWRVLVGVWAPKKWDMSLAALKQYTVPWTPPESPWIDKAKARGVTSSPSLTSVAKSEGSASGTSTPSTSTSLRRHKPPTRRLIKHVLRARVEAARALASFFNTLDASPREKRSNACEHLARQYGGFVVSSTLAARSASSSSGENVLVAPFPLTEQHGYRHVHEVIQFLRSRGANIAKLQTVVADDYWASAALSSDGEYDSGSELDLSTKAKGDTEDLVWIAPAIQAE